MASPMFVLKYACGANPVFLSNLSGKFKLNDINNWTVRNMHDNKRKADQYTVDIECYRILNLGEDCTVSQLRESYIRLAKKYHPDGGTPTADSKKFAEVERAYRVLKDKFEGKYDQQRIENETQEKDFGIKHTAPQHRQFLSYDGVGYGSMMQRQRQYQQYKVSKAVDAVYEHRTQKLATENENALVVKDKKEAKKHKLRNAIDRLVEDLIQESMSRGDFENLPGKGKPLKPSSHNPYLDTITQKLNEVLINNGFTPQWILLEKEIRNERAKLRERLKHTRIRFGSMPLNSKDLAEWSQQVLALQNDVESLNVKISNFNLLVPILDKQMVNFSLPKEAEKILHCDISKLDITVDQNQGQNKTSSLKAASDSNAGLVQLLCEIFR